MRSGLGIADHEALGRGLLHARVTLAQACAQIRAAYPAATAAATLRALQASIKQLDQAREELAEVLQEEHPTLHPRSSEQIYFPQR
jgi:hypothetical protein